MADAEDVRRIALGLPEVVEIDSDGFDFRIGNRGFVWSYPEHVPGRRRTIRTDIAVLYVGDEAEKQALLLSEPDVFFTTPAYDWAPLVMVRLDGLDPDRLAELITDAWHMRAPAELHLDHPQCRSDASGPGGREDAATDVGSGPARTSSVRRVRGEAVDQ